MPKSRKPEINYTIRSPMASYWYRTPTAIRTFIYQWELLKREYPFGISSSNPFMNA